MEQFQFKIQTMTCQSCVNAISKAIKTIDPKAIVHVDLSHKMVKVDSEKQSRDVAQAIESAGFHILEQ
jgi:copper chaperone